MFVIVSIGFILAKINEYFIFLNLILLIAIFTALGCFLRSKIAHLDSNSFESEKRSINMQNFFVTLIILVYLVVFGTLLFVRESTYVVKILDSLFYCLTSCFSIIYLLSVHHKVFKETKAKLRETISTRNVSSIRERTVVQFADLLQTVDADSVPRNSTFAVLLTSKTTVDVNSSIDEG